MTCDSAAGRTWLRSVYNGNLDWLVDNTTFLTVHGSHAYGTNIESSDFDYKGIAIPPLRYFLGWLDHFAQADKFDGVDCAIYDIRKFFDMAADCNPNIIEVLWTDPKHHIIRAGEFDLIAEKRDLFLSKKARHTFSGYAMAQLKRIKLHRRWLLNPPKEEPTRAKYKLPEQTTIPADQRGLIESTIREKGRAVADLEWTEDDWIENAQRITGIPADVARVIWAERAYNNARREWEQYENWKKTRNPKRADLEAKYGYDCKHAGHLVRLLRMGHEILTGQGVIVNRPDAEELLQIRNGAWEFDRLLEWATQQDEVLSVDYSQSTLPHEPPRKQLDELCVSVVERFYTLY